jgi:hypothetical protein
MDLRFPEFMGGWPKPEPEGKKKKGGLAKAQPHCCAKAFEAIWSSTHSRMNFSTVAF